MKIPPSTTCVQVSIIDTGARISNVATSVFLDPPQVGNFTHFKPLPAYSFLIQYEPSGKNYLFDLSIRKDLENLAKRNRDLLEKGGWEVDVPRDVKDVLDENGADDVSIDGIIWRSVFTLCRPRLILFADLLWVVVVIGTGITQVIHGVSGLTRS